MKKIGSIALSILFISLAISASSFSATINDIDGIWDTYSEAKLKISKLGSFIDQNPSETTLSLSRTFILNEITSTGEYTYTGSFDIIDGKKLLFQFDQAGIDELIHTWVDWAEEIASEKGVTISGISFVIESLTLSQPSINRRTLIPKKAKIKAKGIASAWVNSVYYERKFTYTSKVSFVGR